MSKKSNKKSFSQNLELLFEERLVDDNAKDNISIIENASIKEEEKREKSALRRSPRLRVFPFSFFSFFSFSSAFAPAEERKKKKSMANAPRFVCVGIECGATHLALVEDIPGAEAILVDDEGQVHATAGISGRLRSGAVSR